MLMLALSFKGDEMREIKFRAWDKKRSQMVRFGSGSHKDTGAMTLVAVYNENDDKVMGFKTDFYSNMQDFELEYLQYTGLKDKNAVSLLYIVLIVEQKPRASANGMT